MCIKNLLFIEKRSDITIGANPQLDREKKSYVL